MAFVSAKYQTLDALAHPNAPRSVQAIDDQGQVWTLTEDSQVGDWLQYIEGGGTIDEADPPPIIPPEEIVVDPMVALEARITQLEGRTHTLEEKVREPRPTTTE